MKATTFHLIDAINREGISNQFWGVLEDILSTRTEFGTADDIQLKGQYLFAYLVNGETYNFIEDAIDFHGATPYHRLNAGYETIVLWKI